MSLLDSHSKVKVAGNREKGQKVVWDTILSAIWNVNLTTTALLWPKRQKQYYCLRVSNINIM